VVYRIRYRGPAVAGESEAAVEANSPNEAMVKFCHIHNGGQDLARMRGMVTSVNADEDKVPAAVPS
jgi:hypothetical protein